MTLTMIHKELRENLRWAAIGLLLTSAAVTLALFKTGIDTDPRASSGIASTMFQALTTLVCPVAGFMLGLMSALPESRRDRWSFLAHRPITRTRIFLAKSAAALLLYAVAAGLPIAAACLYHAIPGHFPLPFAPGMLLPPLADLAAGAVYIFIGMVVAMRHAGWLKTRIMPLGVGVVCTAMVLGMDTFAGAMIGVAVCAAVTAAAAWGQFHSGGEWRPQPVLARSSLFLSVATGLFLLGAFAGATAFTLFMPERPFSHYVMGPSGKVYMATGFHGQRSTVDPLPGGPAADDQELAALRRNQPGRYTAHLTLVSTHPRSTRNYRSNTRYARLIGSADEVAWFYVPQSRRIVGIDQASSRVVASAGPDGFTSAADARPFDQQTVYSPYTPPDVFTFPSAVYTVDVSARTVRKVFEPRRGDEVRDAVRSPTRPGEEPLLIIATTSWLHIITSGRPAVTLPVTRDPSDYTVAQVGMVEDDRIAVWYHPGLTHYSQGKRLPSHVETYSWDGRKLYEQQVPFRPWSGSFIEDIAPAAGIPVALGLLAMAIIGWQTGLTFDGESPWGAGLMVAGGLLAVAATWWIARRHAMSNRERLAWFVTNFFFGAAGFASMLAVRDWPARLPCPACRTARPVTTDRCQRCGAGWGEPAHDGTEVFEPPIRAAAGEIVAV